MNFEGTILNLVQGPQLLSEQSILPWRPYGNHVRCMDRGVYRQLSETLAPMHGWGEKGRRRGRLQEEEEGEGAMCLEGQYNAPWTGVITLF